jgi:hypothetical protein
MERIHLKSVREFLASIDYFNYSLILLYPYRMS